MKNYHIYFYQVNQSFYEVKANNLNNAIEKAKKEWRRENQPCVLSAEFTVTDAKV